jgi:hypothetical protein
MRTTARTSWRATLYALGAGIVTFLVIGLPTAVIPNAFFMRMTPVRPQDYLLLGITVLLAAALGATYAFPAACSVQDRLTAGGFLAFLAVGCPVCNKVVVLLLGMGGALTYFQPVQPLLGLISIALLGFGLYLRVRAVRVALGSRPDGYSATV